MTTQLVSRAGHEAASSERPSAVPWRGTSPGGGRHSIRLDEFRRGEAAALEAIYWTYVARIERIIGKGLSSWRQYHGGAAFPARDTEDLVQDTFARAFSPAARRTYDGKRDYEPYLSAIARNVLMDAFRAVRGDGLSVAQDQLDALTADEDWPREYPEWAEPRTLAIVRAYLHGLSPALVAVHHQRHVVGMSQELAAKTLGISRQRLRTLEHKLRAGLVHELKRAGISTGG